MKERKTALSSKLRALATRFSKFVWSFPSGNLHVHANLRHLLRKMSSWEELTKSFPYLELDSEESLFQLHSRWMIQMKEKSNKIVEDQLDSFYRMLFVRYREIDYPTNQISSKKADERNLSFTVNNRSANIASVVRRVQTVSRSDSTGNRIGREGTRAFCTIGTSRARLLRNAFSLVRRRM